MTTRITLDRSTLLVLGTMCLVSLVVGAAGTLVGVRVINQFPMLSASQDFYSDEAAIIKAAYDYARQNSEDNDVIFIGDSTTVVSYDVELFTKLTGMSAHGLGLLGRVFDEGTNEILSSYLKQHPRPRLAILTLNPHILARETMEDEFYKSFKTAYSLGDDPARRVADRIGIIEVPRIGIRTLFSWNPGWNDPRIGYMGKYAWNEWHAKLNSLHGCWHIETKEYNAGAGTGETFKLNERRREALCSIIQSAREQDIPLVLRLAPLPDLQPPIDFSELESFVETIERDFNGVTVVKPLILLYEPSVFMDSSHLNINGATRLTSELSEAIIPLMKTLKRKEELRQH